VQAAADLGPSRLVLMHIISQLRPGADLSRVVLPTFILEPRSMLERITKYALLGPVAFEPEPAYQGLTASSQLHVPSRDAASDSCD